MHILKFFAAAAAAVVLVVVLVAAAIKRVVDAYGVAALAIVRNIETKECSRRSFVPVAPQLFAHDTASNMQYMQTFH